MKKQKKQVKYKIGSIHEFGNIHYEVRYINQGIAFLFPLDDYEGKMYHCCAELKLYSDGTLSKI